jgi:hypothetical protein
LDPIRANLYPDGGGAMQDAECEVPRSPQLKSWMNKGPGLYQMWVILGGVMGVETLARPESGIIAQHRRTRKRATALNFGEHFF